MTLFEECKEALSSDFHIVEGLDQENALALLRKYPFFDGNIAWAEVEYSDYESIHELVKRESVRDDYVFVLADEASIPIFRTKLSLIAENIYDVTALSPKLFIFNDDFIIQPLFPTEMFRFGTVRPSCPN